jgi:hypothetical protein
MASAWTVREVEVDSLGESGPPPVKRLRGSGGGFLGGMVWIRSVAFGGERGEMGGRMDNGTRERVRE